MIRIVVSIFLVMVSSTLTANLDNCDKCLGLYCGRVQEKNCSQLCERCPRGYRSNGYFCMRCYQNLKLYDWLYLGFMCLSVCMLNLYSIDKFHSNRKHVWVLHLSALIEFSVSFVGMILILKPSGTFAVHTCGVNSIKDWYTIFHNPSERLVEKWHCTQEVVYPLYTSVFMYLGFSLVTMLLIRMLILKKLFKTQRFSLYAGLYISPIIAVIHASLSGIIYYIFPYLILGFSAIGVAVFLSLIKYSEFYKTLRTVRCVYVVLLYGIAHGYGIVSITELKWPLRDCLSLILVFLPFGFFIITRPFTKPDNFRVVSYVNM